MLNSGHETPYSIAKWASSTFGPATILAVAQRSQKEMMELLLEASKSSPSLTKIQEEAADIMIVLMRLFGQQSGTGLDLTLQEVIDAKMKVNRGRKWTRSADGTGQHVKGTGEYGD